MCVSIHYSLDIAPSLSEVLTQIKNVEKWSKPSRPPFNINFFPMRPLIRKEPKGVVLIISPFNFPIILSLGPLVCAFCGWSFLEKELNYMRFCRQELSLLAMLSLSKLPSLPLLALP